MTFQQELSSWFAPRDGKTTPDPPRRRLQSTRNLQDPTLVRAFSCNLPPTLRLSLCGEDIPKPARGSTIPPQHFFHRRLSLLPNRHRLLARQPPPSRQRAGQPASSRRRVLRSLQRLGPGRGRFQPRSEPRWAVWCVEAGPRGGHLEPSYGEREQVAGFGEFWR